MPIVNSILETFTAIVGWLVESLNSASAIFFGTEGLTVIGTISILGLGFGIVLLLFNWVRDVLNFRR